MKNLFLVILFLFPVVLSYAKDDKIKFGKVDADVLKMQVYEKDSSASAVILYEKGYSAIKYDQTNGWKLSFAKHQRIKILKKEGVEWANYEIGLSVDGGTDEELSNIKAVTLNLVDGKIVKDELKNKEVYKTEVNKYYNTETFTLPNVKVGSVIDVKYTINCKAFFRNMRPWRFQHSIPTIYSEYTVDIPEYFHFRKFVLGFERFTTQEETSTSSSVNITEKSRSGGSGFSAVKTNYESYSANFNLARYHWIAKDMPEFNDEAYVSSVKNYIQQVQFELQSIKFPNSKLYTYSQSWTSINENLTKADNFGGVVFSSSKFLQEKVDGLVSGASNDMEKVAVLLSYIRSNYKYTGRHTIYCDGLRKVEKDKSGSVADLNFLLIACLKLAGLDAKPVILSTRSNGIFLFPTVTGFNYVVTACNIDGKYILLDAAGQNCGINELPYKCLNGKGLIVGGSQPDWINLYNVGKSDEKYIANLLIDETGKLSGLVNIVRTGYAAQIFRNKVTGFNSADKYKEDFEEKNHDWEIESHDIGGVEALSGRATEVIKLSLNNKSTFAGDKIYVSPLIFNVYDDNPFKLKERKFPVDFGYVFKETEMVTYSIPEGYAIEELPKSQKLVLPESKASFVFSVTKVGDKTVSVATSLSVNKAVFYAEDYETLKEFFNRIVDAENQQIILKKI